jgi:3-deoxy-D-manno-octulosonic-acid transferase
MRLLVPALLVRLWWRGRRHAGYRRAPLRRLGYYPSERAQEGAPRIWLHAVSVGETLAIAPLVEKLLAERADWRLLITSTTPTGAERVRDVFGERVDRDWAPFDTPGAVRRFLDHWRPSLAAFVETEIWPNAIALAVARDIPTVLLNARLSARSARGYARLGGLAFSTVSQFTLIAAQTRADARRFRFLGAEASRVAVTGSLKFEFDLNAVQAEGNAERVRLGVTPDRPVWLAASTHQDEETVVLDAFAQLQNKLPRACLILAPRHPERTRDILALPAARRCRLRRYSDSAEWSEDDDVLLVDSLGKLSALTGCADLVFVGGSLVPHGGHNPLEAAAWGLPVLTGPHVFNFAQVYQQLIQAGGAQMISRETLAGEVLRKLGSEDGREEARAQGLRAQRYLEAKRGALARQWDLLKPYLDANHRR